jgi:hypothetical protein
MLKRTIGPALAVAVFLTASACARAADEEARPDAAGVRAVEDHWTRAYFTGETAFLEAMLDDAYQSVGATGGKDKAAIVDGARAFGAANKGATAPTLPPTSKIEVRGQTAVVTHLNPTDRSVDVFYYRDGHWRAIYSQHTPRADAAPPA